MTSKYYAFAAVATAFIAVTSYLFSRISTVIIVPYMDEIFHIPQAQKYCQGLFTHWDSKITTPPGLYLFSLGLNKISQSVVPHIRNCGIPLLRSTNVLLALGNLYVFFAITTTLNRDKNKKVTSVWHCTLTALNVATFPTLFFFTFLYYTDTGSTFFTLFAYLLSLKKRHFLAAVALSPAILFRQTNVVWAAFLGCVALNEVLERHVGAKELKKADKRKISYLKVLARSAYNLALNKRKQGYSSLLFDLLTTCGGYILVGLGFLAFLVWNGGIVLGDRSAHHAVLHFPQLLYFAAFTLFFSSPHLISPVYLRHYFATIKRHPLTAFFLTLTTVAAIFFGTMAHPYLLADNRHYTFYVWRKLLAPHPLARYLPVPIYLYALVTVYELLKNSRGLLWSVAFLSATSLTLIPQGLLEFRYFVVPYVLFRLSLPVRGARELLLEFMLYLLVNTLTIYVFVAKPFVWADSDFLQRFMW